MGQRARQNALPDAAHALQPHSRSGAADHDRLLQISQQDVTQRGDACALVEVVRRQFGDGDQFAGGRQRVAELADQVGDVRVELGVVAEVLGMDEPEIFGDQAVCVDLLAGGIDRVRPDDRVDALEGFEVGEPPFLRDVIRTDSVGADDEDEPIAGIDGITDFLVEGERT